MLIVSSESDQATNLQEHRELFEAQDLRKDARYRVEVTQVA